LIRPLEQRRREDEVRRIKQVIACYVPLPFEPDDIIVAFADAPIHVRCWPVHEWELAQQSSDPVRRSRIDDSHRRVKHRLDSDE
jgi:hypothetical protein